MKKYFAIALAAVAAMACQKEIGNYESNLGPFTASIESYDETKTFTDASLEVKWSKDDYLNVWEHNAIADKYTISDASVGKNTADLVVAKKRSSGFSSKLPANIGYYPYSENIACEVSGDSYKLTDIVLPSTQAYAAGSFGNGALPMVAVTSGENDYSLNFRNVCGVLRVVLTGDMLVKTVSVKGNNDEVLCGSAEIVASNNAMPTVTMTGDGKTVTLDCGDGVQLNKDEATSFDIVLPPVVFEKGFTVKINGVEHISTSKSLAIKRSHILCMSGKSVASNDYLKFTSSGETTVSLNKTGTPDDITLLYFKDSEEEWRTYTIGETISLSSGESLCFKAGEGGNQTFSKGNSHYYKFAVEGSGRIYASGNIMSLLDAKCESLTCPADCFYKLFENCTNLITAPELPATTLATECYAYMFYGCTSLVNAPALPATVLASSCYYWMFYDCSELVKAPKLPATTLTPFCYLGMFLGCSKLAEAPDLPAATMARSCYSQMFENCSSLTSAPVLSSTSLADYCYFEMFQGCTGITSAPELPAVNLTNSCYYGMFYRCTGLTCAPKLPATVLAASCYAYMFSYCTGLTAAPELPSTVLADYCYEAMFSDCSGLKSAPELPSTKMTKRCYGYMFSRCTGLTSTPSLPAVALDDFCYTRMFYHCTGITTAPDLPATTLTTCCYLDMFNGCGNLNYIKMLATDISAINCMRDWTKGVSSKGTFVKNADATWDVSGTSGIPNGWTVKTE